MINTNSLVITAGPIATASSLVAAGGLVLPTTVKTAAWAVVMRDGLRLLINNSGRGETSQWRISPTNEIEPLPSLPLMAAGLIYCGQELVITGADTQGRALVLGVTEDGQNTWRAAMQGPAPIRWPLPGCVGVSPMIIWQTAQGRLEIAEVGPGGIGDQRSVVIGPPPLEIAIGAAAVWVAWPGPKGIEGLEIRAQQTHAIRIGTRYPGGLAIGASPEGAGLAWTQGQEAFFAPMASGGKGHAGVMALELPRADKCRLTVIPGPQPVIWARYAETEGERVLRWSSAFVFPGDRPLSVEGLVHYALWWGSKIVLIGTNEMIFLEIKEK